MLAVVMGLQISSITALAAPKEPYTACGNLSITDEDGTKNTYTLYDGGEDPRNVQNHGFEVGDAWTADSSSVGLTVYYLYKEDGSWETYKAFVEWDDSDYPDYVKTSTKDSDKSKSRDKEAEAKAIAQRAQEEALREAALQAEALKAEAEAAGFTDGATMQIAQAENKSAGEYYNNAVLTTQGIEEATPVAQGGNLVIDGVETNMTASITKVLVAFVDSIRNVQDGRILNVVNVQFPAKAATVNFYMPGVTDDANITAMQYVDGAWIDVEVVEVRVDHVVLNLKGNGAVAFVAK